MPMHSKLFSFTLYFFNKKDKSGMLFGKLDELVYIGLDVFQSAVHGGGAVGLFLQSGALSPDGAQLLPGEIDSSATVRAFQIAAKNEYLVRLQFHYPIGCNSSIFHCPQLLIRSGHGAAYHISGHIRVRDLHLNKGFGDTSVSVSLYWRIHQCTQYNK